MPLFHFFESLVPHALGEWSADITAHHSVETQAHRAGPQAKKTKISNSKVTFSVASIPDGFKDITDFNGFEYVKAKIESDAWPLVNEKNEHTVIFEAQLKEAVRSAKPTAPMKNYYVKEVLLVKANEVLIHFFKKYNLGLCPLAYFYSATPLASYNYVAEIARELIQNQLGIDTPNVYDSQRTYFCVKSENKENCEKYLLFDYVLAMYAFAQLQGERKFILPDNNACIIFNGGVTHLQENNSEIMFFDYGLPLEDRKVPLNTHPTYSDKLKDIITLMKRKNKELSIKQEQLKRKEIEPKKGFRTPTNNEKELKMQKFLKEIAKNPPDEIRLIIQDVQKGYIELTKIAKENKEPALYEMLKRDQLKQDIQVCEETNSEMLKKFIKFNSNIEGLPAHFASIPIGYCQEHALTSDDELGKIIKIERKPLIYKGEPLKDHEPLVVELNTDVIMSPNQNELIEYVNLIFGEKPCPGFFLQGLVALFKVYDNHKGFATLGKKVTVTFEEFIDTIRPNREKRQRAFGHERDPREIFRAVCEIQEKLFYRRTLMKKISNKQGVKSLNHRDTIRGFFKLLRDVKQNKYEYYNVVFNEDLFSLVNYDQDEKPLFMPVNARAMLAYEGKSLDYVPAAQLSLELYAKENIYGKNRSTIFSGKEEFKSGITRKAFMHRFGLLKGKSEDNCHLLKRLDRIWGNLKEHGIIDSVKIDGKEAKDKLDTKLFVDMHNDYVQIFNITKKRQELKKTNYRLNAPLNIKNLIRKKK